MRASGRTIEATGTMSGVSRTGYSRIGFLSARTDAAYAKVEPATSTTRTVPMVITRLFQKNFKSGLSWITVAKLSKVIGKTKRLGSNDLSGGRSDTLTM